ncbi:MAG: hypothetical protein JWP38_2278 [Herbaspirillum sp.]|nr:hypothetical protein [Herbaspirillum sp.]
MTTTNNKGRNACQPATQTTCPDSNGTSAEAQRARLLAALKRGPIDTVHAYRILDILHVPRRVFELRGQGYVITTSWISRITEQGFRHRVGLYELEAK